MTAPEDGDTPIRDPTPSPPTLSIPRNRSTGSLLQPPPPAAPVAQNPRSSSFDEATTNDASLTRSDGSPILNEKDRHFGHSGLHRIRQNPQARLAPSKSYSSSSTQSRPTSMTLNIPPPAPIEGQSAPVSPLLDRIDATDDLKRFPTESLHSFSFANQAEDSIHNRQNVLKRSIDFMRGKMGIAAGGLGIVNAQAKLNGDQETQSMMDLLNKANLLGRETSPTSTGTFNYGPITGPAHSVSENVFERSFMTRSESPESMSSTVRPDDSDGGSEESSSGAETPKQENFDGNPRHDVLIRADTAPTVKVDASKRRSSLKRTYTDTAPLSLQHKLAEAMAQPYLANENALVSPTGHPSIGGAISNGPGFPNTSSHHGRAAPTSQAIFTTQGRAPWTITAANDLACLTFGVTKAEVKKIGILEMVREDKRKWLESKLRGASPTHSPSPTQTRPTRRSPSPGLTSNMKNGVTAKLLSKPSSRESSQGRRVRSDDGSDSTLLSGQTSNASSQSRTLQSRGVILCGDVVPIIKRNGTSGSATLWVQEKRNNLIWVLEEIAEDVALLSVDEIGSVTKASGQVEAVWGMERVRRGMDIIRLVPGIPRLKGTNTGALDFAKIAELRQFTARTSNDISIPVTVDQVPEESTFRVSSFPHIAGMMVLSKSTLKVSSANAVVTESLFGRIPNGSPIMDLIPGFDKMLNLLVEEDQVQLIEGMVIPEHSFRRARAMLALREGKADAAAVFLRPSGVPAIHRDGAEIMIDVQMRIVKSESLGQTFNDRVIAESEDEGPNASASEIVYALWVTYSRTLHAVNHGVGPISPLVSRPGTPPKQPQPNEVAPVAIHHDSDSDDAQDTTKDDYETTPSGTTPPAKKSINDFVILEDMGAGAYGQVKLARPKSSIDAPKVVIKYVTKRRILVDTWTRDRRLGTVPLEIHVLDYLRRDGFKHPNIVEMSDFFEDDINYYIEMVPHGLPGMDLFDYIELRVDMKEDECQRIFRQVASAVEFLHLKAKVVHRDIKDENVILDGEGNIKLIDFGSAAYIKSGPFDVFVGTIDYAAPEVLAGSSYNGKEQDVWALGILLYTILYKENPFYSIDEIMDRDLRVPYIVSEGSIDLVRRMLNRVVENRYTIQDVTSHPWCAAEVTDQ